MSNLYIMVGIPGSGKSYYLKDKTNVVSRDKVRFSIISNEDEYFSKEKEVFKEFVRQIQEYIDKGEDVYADATHLNGVSRFKLMNALNLDKVDIIPIVMRTPYKICLERNAKREGRACVPESAINRMKAFKTDPINDVGHMKYAYKDIIYIDYIGEDE